MFQMFCERWKILVSESLSVSQRFHDVYDRFKVQVFSKGRYIVIISGGTFQSMCNSPAPLSTGPMTFATML